MRTLISNLNVIRATGVYGVLCNGINGISTRIEMLTERIADTAWRAVRACHQEFVARHEERLHERQFHEESREMFWKPLDASAGSFAAGSFPFGSGSEKRSRFSQGVDQTCHARSRSWGQPQVLQLAAIRNGFPSNGFHPAG